MSLDFKTLRREKENFKVDSSAPVYVPGGVVSANDMACLAAWFEITNSTVDAGNPGTVTIEYSPDDGSTWVTLPGTTSCTITANGANWNIQTSSGTGVFPPLIRFKFIAAAGKVYTVAKIRRSFVTPGLVAPLRGGAAAPTPVGSPSFVALSDGTNSIAPFDNYALNTQWTDNTQAYKVPVSASLVGWDFTNNLRKEIRTDTNGDLQTKVMNFPTSVLQGNALIPVAYDYIGMDYTGVTADVYTYKTGGAGGVTVATLTVNYTGVDKSVISSVVRT
jgi:hypothetical protein